MTLKFTRALEWVMREFTHLNTRYERNLFMVHKLIYVKGDKRAYDLSCARNVTPLLISYNFSRGRPTHSWFVLYLRSLTSMTFVIEGKRHYFKCKSEVTNVCFILIFLCLSFYYFVHYSIEKMIHSRPRYERIHTLVLVHIEKVRR